MILKNKSRMGKSGLLAIPNTYFMVWYWSWRACGGSVLFTVFRESNSLKLALSITTPYD